MGREKKMTAATFGRKTEAYFNSIRTVRPLLQKIPVTEEGENGALLPKLDVYGHELYRYEQVYTADGKPAMEEFWVEPPSIIGLSLFLGVDRTTLYRWKNLRESKTTLTAEDEKFCNIATRAWGRIEAYLICQTENPKKVKGATANLEANFGWKQRKEVGFDEKTTNVVSAATVSSEEKLKELLKMGLKLPWMDEEQEEHHDE